MQRTADHSRYLATGEICGEIASLLQPGGVQRHVKTALEATLAVPIGPAVADDVEFHGVWLHP